MERVQLQHEGQEGVQLQQGQQRKGSSEGAQPLHESQEGVQLQQGQEEVQLLQHEGQEGVQLQQGQDPQGGTNLQYEPGTQERAVLQQELGTQVGAYLPEGPPEGPLPTNQTRTGDLSSNQPGFTHNPPSQRGH